MKVLKKIFDLTVKNDCSTVRIEYNKTSRNKITEDFLRSLMYTSLNERQDGFSMIICKDKLEKLIVK